MRSRAGHLILENVRLTSGSPVAGKTIEDSRKYSRGATILAIQKRNGNLLTNPPEDTVLDELVVIGTREQLRELEDLA
ncbi:MAG: TrkA C-terminal domain-containing protein [Dehalococcoidales bacterium]|nr:TrkA C-terminal domain-containing protein [Dehalococcoidales bacterium]